MENLGLVHLDAIIVESNGDAVKAFRTYGKHWGELKGFALALETGGKSLGETGEAYLVGPGGML